MGITFTDPSNCLATYCYEPTAPYAPFTPNYSNFIQTVNNVTYQVILFEGPQGNYNASGGLISGKTNLGGSGTIRFDAAYSVQYYVVGGGIWC